MSASIGFYGKLPIIGDFVSRRLPSDFIAPWDNWLQSAIAASREELGDSWLNSYLTSPIWRFLLSPGVCGSQAVAGIVMPSVDKVGRYFPLTVAVVFDEAESLPLFFTKGKVWFELLEDAALSGLEGNLDINSFEQLLQSIPVFALPVTLNTKPHTEPKKKTFYAAMENLEQMADAFIELNAQLLTAFMPGYSLWTTEGSALVETALLACEGLPAINNYAKFLNSGLKPVNNQPLNTSSERTIVPEQPTLSSILNLDSPSLNPRWQSWAITHTGKRRKHNEDSVLNRPEAGLWVVADGMGGHQAGDVASQLIVNTLQNITPLESLESTVKAVEQCLQQVNTQLRELAAKEYDHQLVGSTVVVLIADAQRCAVLWAGDSRLYRLRNNQLQQLTQDHCVGNEPSSSRSVKSSNIITRAVGAADTLNMDSEFINRQQGDIFLLSSDGLDKELSRQDIESIMQTNTLADIAAILIDKTLDHGARDNVSVIVVSAENVL